MYLLIRTYVSPNKELGGIKGHIPAFEHSSELQGEGCPIEVSNRFRWMLGGRMENLVTGRFCALQLKIATKLIIGKFLVVRDGDWLATCPRELQWLQTIKHLTSGCRPVFSHRPLWDHKHTPPESPDPGTCTPSKIFFKRSPSIQLKSCPHTFKGL